MLMNPTKMIYIFAVMFGTILACSSSSWILAWVGLEINLMSFTPILINKLNSITLELTIKYFLVQAMASMIVITSSVISFFNINESMLPELNTLLLISLSMKTGVAPFHFWFPQIMEYANWFQALMILTWQKIAPMILLSFTLNFFIPVIILTSALVGMIGGLNQTTLKKILTYSSIIHSAWMISILYLSDLVWCQYFFIYSILTLSVIVPAAVTQLQHISSINTMKINIKMKIMMFINMLSLAGLPPFLGFAAKMVSINIMVYSHFSFIILSSLIVSSLVAFYFYARLIYSSLLLFSSKLNLINQLPQTDKFLTHFILLSFLGNSAMSVLVLLT
uniref:NADH-ubiquinone oxidoreductase chain 2 n=1 Tax=Ceratophysella communis TaxID=1519100 RepID=A0A6G6A4F5_9HEXA